MKPGDQILCYLSGVSKFVAVLEVLSEAFLDDWIWDESLFPCRLEVSVVVSVPYTHAIPIRELPELSIFHIRNWVFTSCLPQPSGNRRTEGSSRMRSKNAQRSNIEAHVGKRG